MGNSQLDRFFRTPDVSVVIFRALCDVLREDPVLQTLPITWRVMDGDPNDLMPVTRSQMPCVTLTPVNFEMRPATEIEDGGKFPVRIDVWVAGTCWEDLANLAGAVRDALKWDRVFRETTVSKYLQDAGCNLYRVARAGVGARRTEQPPPDTALASPPAVVDLTASAVVEFDVFYPTIE